MYRYMYAITGTIDGDLSTIVNMQTCSKFMFTPSDFTAQYQKIVEFCNDRNTYKYNSVLPFHNNMLIITADSITSDELCKHLNEPVTIIVTLRFFSITKKKVCGVRMIVNYI